MSAPIRAIARRPADPKVVEAMREMLAKAESGEIQSIAGVAVDPGAGVVTFRAQSKHESVFQLIGALRILEAKLVRDAEEESPV